MEFLFLILTNYNRVIQWEKKNIKYTLLKVNGFKFVKRSDKVAAEVLTFACMFACLRNKEMAIYGCE